MMMNKISYESYMKRFSKAKSEKSNILETLKECYRYALPSANVDGYGSGSNTIDETPEVFDDTAKTALGKYANRTQSQITPSWKTWAMLKAGTDIPKEEREEIDTKLEEVTEVIFDHIHHSNFLSAAHESFKDLGISTGALLVEAGDGINSSLTFRAIPMMELIPERSTDGKIKTVWREFRLEAIRIADMYPKANLNTDISQAIKDNPNSEIDLVEGVVYDFKTRLYNHILLHPASADTLLDEKIESSPYIVFRESTIAGQAFGDGRIMNIISTILKLNNLSYYEDVSVGLNAAGIYTVRDDGVISPDNIRVEPFGIIPVMSNETSNKSISPLEMGTNFNVTDIKIKELQGEVRDVMQSQSFGNIEETPVRTAYEMSVRENDRMQTMHGAYGRLQTELLEPLLARIVYVLSEAGKIPPLRVNGREITIKFTSPAARVQDSEELLALQEFMMYMENVPPEITSAKFKLEEIPDFVAQRTGLPASMMRNKAEEEQAVQGMQGAAIKGQQIMTDATVPNVAAPQ